MSDQGRMQAVFRSGITSLARATGWREIHRTAGDIRALGQALRNGPANDGVSAGERFDLTAIAARTGGTRSEIERRMQNRQRETKWASRIFAGGLALSALSAAVILPAYGAELFRMIWLTGMAAMLTLGYVYNTLLNWQLRVRRPVSVGELLQHPNEWWAR